MKFPQIQIRTTDAKLGLDIVNARQSIRQPRATQQIQQPAATVDIETTDGFMKIDTSQARRDIGMIGPLESTKKYANEGRQKLLQGIARRAKEGKQMADIATNKNAIVQIAAQHTFPVPDKLGIKFVPSIGSVKLNYSPAKLDINVQVNKPVIDSQVNQPIYEYTPGNVSGYMLQYPSIEIDVMV